ncbi:MAG TPA: FMN-binding negative transcriptional regulator [Caldimonas sp.]
MYLPSHFEETRLDVLHQFVLSHPFGLLVTQGGSGIDANGIPFLLDPDGAGGFGTLRAHVARANPVWREARTDTDTLVVFQGPHAYISPAWNASKAEHGKAVPTWNYCMVQARGPLRVMDDAGWVRSLVTRLTERHEAPRSAPWSVDDAPDDYIEMMLRAIVGIEIPLVSLTGKWKVTQNRPLADREGVVRGLGAQGGDAAQALARQVARPGEPS